MEAPAKSSGTAQSTSAIVSHRPTSAAPADRIITSNDVPEAARIPNPNTSVRAGTTANPPPTPKNPVSRPVTVAATATTTGDARRALLPPCGALSLCAASST